MEKNDAETKFGEIKKLLKHDGCAVTVFNPPEPVMIASPQVLVKFMKSIEENYGDSVAELIMYDAGFYAAERMCDKILHNYNIKPEEGFATFVEDLYVRGWGNMSVVEYNYKQATAKVKWTNSIFAEEWKNTGLEKCYYYAGLFGGMMKGFTGIEVRCEEKLCKSKGDPVCEFHVFPD